MQGTSLYALLDNLMLKPVIFYPNYWEKLFIILELALLMDFNFKGQNQTIPIPTFTETGIDQRKTLVKMWNISTSFGIIGTILNGIILFNFYLERNALFTVVNVMIW